MTEQPLQQLMGSENSLNATEKVPGKPGTS